MVIPGCGLAWVPSALIVSRRQVPSKCESLNVVAALRNNGPLAGANIKAFKRRKARVPDDILHLMSLLRVIGHSLDELSYPSHGIRIGDSDLLDILEFCPNLTRLDLRGNTLVSVDALSLQYAQQKCQISCLDICSMANETRVMTSLILALWGNKTLRYIAVSGAVDPDRWEHLERAITKNRTLELLYLDSARPEDEEAFNRI